MRNLSLVASFGFLALSSYPALACRGDDYQADVARVRSADLVVAGRIVNYQVHRSGRSGGNYAHFDILIDEVLSGSAAKTVSVTLDYKLYTELPSMEPGPYIIALRAPISQYPTDPSPEPMAVIQEGCDPAFIFETRSKEAADVRRILGSPDH